MAVTLEKTKLEATVNVKILREALELGGLVFKRQKHPVTGIFSAVYFNDGKAILTSKDDEKYIQITLDAKTDKPFSTLLSRKIVGKFLCGGVGEVTISAHELPHDVRIKRVGIGAVNVSTPDVKEFPMLPTLNFADWQNIDSKWFCRMISILSPCCAQEESRPILTGICVSDGAMASADGFRLAVAKNDKLSFGLSGKQVIIPSVTMNTVRRLFAKEDKIEVSFDLINNYVSFKSDKITLVSQTINGNYPKWEQLVPQSYTCKVSFSALLMLQRLNLMTPSYTGIVRFNFARTESGEHLCSIGARAEEEFDYDITMPVNIENEGGKIAFNWKYVAEAIKPFSICNLEISSPSSPGKITGDIEGLTIVVMPMYVQW